MEQKMPPKLNERRTILAVAAAVSIVLYLAGVFSGLYASKIVEERTRQDMSLLLSKTENDMALLRGYIELLEANVKDMQLEQVFIQTLSHEQRCAFSSLTMSGLLKQMSFYWNKLPFRIEEYERNNPLTPEYLLLKKQYTQTSIRTWILARDKYQVCRTSFIPVLYMYSQNCIRCVEQGEQLDLLQRLMGADSEQQSLVFTVDIDSDVLMVTYLKEYYNITSAPALVINEQVLQGRLFSTQEILARTK